MMAQDAKYHMNCLSKLHGSSANKQLEGNFSDHKRKLRGVAFGEVVAFIEETLLNATEKSQGSSYLISSNFTLHNCLH